ncbi:MAG: RnfABCDGE type electron transport complex subunit D [Planctomycetota bacterium]
MKFLQKILEGMKKKFEEVPLLRPLKPVIDATDAFFFSPAAVTETVPHIRDGLDVKRYMSLVIVAALPAVVMSVYFFGLRVIAMILVSYIAGGLAETIFCIVRKEEITEGFLVTGLLFPLTLPPGCPLWVVAVGCVFGVIFGKEVFGGTGTNIFNPALVGRCFLAIAYPKIMAGGWIEPGSGLTGRAFQYAADAVTTATPLVAKDWNWGACGRVWLGNCLGCAGETCALAILLGGVFLCLVRVANWRVPAGCLATVAIFSGIMSRAMPTTFAPPLFQLGAGGLMFGVFFMATDPVTSPITNPGKWVYAVLMGIVAVLIRSLTGYPEGIMFSILLMNMAAPLMDEIVYAHRRRGYARA